MSMHWLIIKGPVQVLALLYTFGHLWTAGTLVSITLKESSEQLPCGKNDLRYCLGYMMYIV